MKSIHKISVNFRGGKEIPSPTLIHNAGQWYLLDHLSSGLVYYDHEQKVYRPLIAEKWESRTPLEYRFFLRKDIKFNDGSPLVAKDVVATIKNQLVAKSSTHFPLWEYLVDCANLKTINDKCKGVEAQGDHIVDFRFKKPMTSFYLQLASPETGIWSYDDLLANSMDGFKPKKFSGPYFFDYEKSDKSPYVVLRKNYNSPLISEFKMAPEVIHSYHYDRSEAVKAFNDGDLDLIVDYYQPFPDETLKRSDSQIYRTTPSMMTYLRSVKENTENKIGRDFVKMLWKAEHNQDILNASEFLAPGVAYNLNQKDFLQALPDTSAPELKIGYISSFHTYRFAKFIKQIGHKLDIKVEFVDLKFDELIQYFERTKSDLDFLLVPYAASERVPSVHLRFLTGPLKEISPVFDIKRVETPNIDDQQIKDLQRYQKWLLESQLAIPLFYHKTEIFYSSSINLGEQPKTDAEVELWRLTNR